MGEPRSDHQEGGKVTKEQKKGVLAAIEALENLTVKDFDIIADEFSYQVWADAHYATKRAILRRLEALLEDKK